VRSFASFKGQKNFTGEYWAAISRSLVGYESWVERDAAMALDFDLSVVALVSAYGLWCRGAYGLIYRGEPACRGGVWRAERSLALTV
jgi:hypothetical protein